MALVDSLFFLKKKFESKLLRECVYLGFIAFSMLYVCQIEFNLFFRFVLTYIFLRIALFDVFFNLFSDLGINYLGSTDAWNKLLKRLKLWQFWVLRLFFLFLAIIIWATWKA